LLVDHLGGVFVEGIFIGEVAAIFDAGEQSFDPLVLVGGGEFFNVLFGAGLEAVGVVEVFKAAGEG